MSNVALVSIWKLTSFLSNIITHLTSLNSLFAVTLFSCCVSSSSSLDMELINGTPTYFSSGVCCFFVYWFSFPCWDIATRNSFFHLGFTICRTFVSCVRIVTETSFIFWVIPLRVIIFKLLGFPCSYALAMGRGILCCPTRLNTPLWVIYCIFSESYLLPWFHIPGTIWYLISESRHLSQKLYVFEMVWRLL